MKCTWTKLAQTDQLKRSSHSLSVVDGNAYVFGGELKPRQPRDNDLYQFGLQDGATVQNVNYKNDPPTPRVGSASCTLQGKIFFFSGRGGEAMAPVDEEGSVWTFDPSSGSWKILRPVSAYPPARSYHAMTSDGHDTIYLHAGCPAQGRLSDLWAFSVSRIEWTELAAAPDPPRGGPSIAFADGRLYRMNGFDGKSEQGGAVDVYDPASNSWSSIAFAPDGKTGPGARSVAALLPVRIDGETSLVTLFGESDPSSLGHQGAGKMLSDVWVYSIAEGRWSQINAEGGGQPEGRGWFDADTVGRDGSGGIVVAGGLGESNERLDDAWLLSFT